MGKEHPGIDFVLTRSSDQYVSLLDRLQKIRDQGSLGYLSIHANSFWDPDVNGVETIVDRTREREGKSWKMAESIQKSLAISTGARDRGLRYQRLYTRHTKVPSAIVEVGFLTSPSERAKLTDSGYHQTIARGIIQGLLIYYS